MAMLNNQRVGQIITMLEGFDLSFFSGIPIKMIKSVFVSPVLATGIPIAPSCRLLPWSTAQAATKHLPGAAGLFVKNVPAVRLSQGLQPSAEICLWLPSGYLT